MIDGNIIVITTTGIDGITLICDYEGEYYHLIEFKVKWIVNSSASYHCFPKREYFTSYKVGSLGSTNMENNSISQIIGIGIVCVQTKIVAW